MEVLKVDFKNKRLESKHNTETGESIVYYEESCDHQSRSEESPVLTQSEELEMELTGTSGGSFLSNSVLQEARIRQEIREMKLLAAKKENRNITPNNSNDSDSVYSTVFFTILSMILAVMSFMAIVFIFKVQDMGLPDLSGLLPILSIFN